MKSIIIYTIIIIIVVALYPFMGEVLFKIGVRDMHMVAFAAISSLLYLKFQFYFATSSNLEKKSIDDKMSFVPAGVLLVVILLMVIFYNGIFYQYWFINIFILGLTIWIDISVGNYVGNLLLKKTSEFTQMK